MRFTSAILLVFGYFLAVGQSLKQGIQGQVFWLSGNQMPGPEKTVAPHQGVVREIYFYKIATANEVVQENNFLTEIKTELVAKTISQPDGSFKIKLPPGEYTVVTKEKNGLYANLFDKDNRINPVSVKPKRYSWVTITLDYEAAY
ncbi:MAG: hypothetical protein JNM57_13930 [Cyclobacteriaceae bacterium]|nr:hypothetical protein [Cyclobacteriaceae bacterium]